MNHWFLFVRRFAVFCHRWMGVVFCLPFTWWFVSGIFMMYLDFPAVRDADRLSHAQLLDASRIRVSPQQAYQALGFDFPPDQVRLAMFDGRPAYWFGAIPDQVIVYADDGTVQIGYPPELNLRTAAAWMRHSNKNQPANRAKVEEIREPDQWTVTGALRDLRPLFKYSWPDGQQVYVARGSMQFLFISQHDISSRLFARPPRDSGRRSLGPGPRGSRAGRTLHQRVWIDGLAR